MWQTVLCLCAALLFQSAKGTDARGQTANELADFAGRALDTVAVLRVFPKGVVSTPAQTPENRTPAQQTEPQKPATQENPETPAPPPVPSKPQFFGGTVTALDGKSITVSRTLVGKPPEHRTFAITSKTKLSRSVKLRSRVTVRYQHIEESDVALDVFIRPAPKVSKG